MSEWKLHEELRPQIQEWFFNLLCIGPRGWMLWRPFRWLLFRKAQS